MTSLLPGFGGSALRSLKASVPCQYCAKRMASRARPKRTTLEVELSQDVPRLGQAGQRLEVAPGMMRNHLYPKGLALYVLRGKTLTLDGTFKAGSERTSSRSVLSGGGAVSSLPGTQGNTPALVEGRILAELGRVQQPLVFARKTTGEGESTSLHGSVTVQEVLAALKEQGVQLPASAENEATFRARDLTQKGIENGRIKRTGEYELMVKVGTDNTVPIVVRVDQEA